MIYVTLALIACNVIAMWAFVGVVSRMQRASARREALLVNQIMALAGKPWETPPALEPEEIEPVERKELVSLLPTLIANPEQLP